MKLISVFVLALLTANVYSVGNPRAPYLDLYNALTKATYEITFKHDTSTTGGKAARKYEISQKGRHILDSVNGNFCQIKIYRDFYLTATESGRVISTTLRYAHELNLVNPSISITDQTNPRFTMNGSESTLLTAPYDLIISMPTNSITENVFTIRSGAVDRTPSRTRSLNQMSISFSNTLDLNAAKQAIISLLNQCTI